MCGTCPYVDWCVGKSFEQRRGIVSRFKALAALFATGVAAFAVMSNRYDLAVRVDVPGQRQLS